MISRSRSPSIKFMSLFTSSCKYINIVSGRSWVWLLLSITSCIIPNTHTHMYTVMIHEWWGKFVLFYIYFSEDQTNLAFLPVNCYVWTYFLVIRTTVLHISSDQSIYCLPWVPTHPTHAMGCSRGDYQQYTVTKMIREDIN